MSTDKTLDSKFLLSFDVEDWFHVENLSGQISRSNWGQNELRVGNSTRWILDLLDEHQTKATFFVLGWVAEKLPELVHEIDERGHEIASHGYNHKLLNKMSEEEFKEDVKKSVDLISEITGLKPLGYRAPNFSINDRSLEFLSREGFSYDSSYFPSFYHDRYGKITVDEKSQISWVSSLREIPMSVNPFFGLNLPWAGGGYFRMLPYSIYREGVKSAHQKNGHFCFYLHSWEVDPGQPRVSGLSWSQSFRHYYGLDTTREKLKQLLQDFDFVPMKAILGS